MHQDYSHKTLIEKLEIKECSKVIFFNTPEGYVSSLSLPSGVLVENNLEGQFDLIQFFAQDKTELEKNFPQLKKFLKTNGALWISWKKKKPRGLIGLNEIKVQEIGLQNGLVDIKVISIDEVWSGLKFVFKIKDRI